MTYPPIIKEIGGKKPRQEFIWRNTIGISGGKFTKTDMFLSIVDNNEIDDFWSKHCKLSKSDILSVATIPKPYEDVNDAYLIYKILQK